MPGTVPHRRPHWHAPEKGTGPAFALSLFAHALLFLSIAFVVRWKTEPVGPVSAELWGGLPAAAPAPAPAPAPVVEPTPPPPPPKVEPAPEPERKADIVMEQKKKPEPPKKVEPPKKIEPPKKVEPPKKAEPPKPDPKKLEAEKREVARAQADADKRRTQEIQRMTAAAGSPGASPTAPAGGGTGVGGGYSDSYKGQIVGCIRPHIVFNVPDGIAPKQHVAEFEVQLLPTGEQATAPKLLKASGLVAYDQAVERAIRRCDPFPRPREGAMPRSLRLAFDPVDTR